MWNTGSHDPTPERSLNHVGTRATLVRRPPLAYRRHTRRSVTITNIPTFATNHSWKGIIVLRVWQKKTARTTQTYHGQRPDKRNLASSELHPNHRERHVVNQNDRQSKGQLAHGRRNKTTLTCHQIQENTNLVSNLMGCCAAHIDHHS